MEAICHPFCSLATIAAASRITSCTTTRYSTRPAHSPPTCLPLGCDHHSILSAPASALSLHPPLCTRGNSVRSHRSLPLWGSRRPWDGGQTPSPGIPLSLCGCSFLTPPSGHVTEPGAQSPQGHLHFHSSVPLLMHILLPGRPFLLFVFPTPTHPVSPAQMPPALGALQIPPGPTPASLTPYLYLHSSSTNFGTSGNNTALITG